MSQTKTLANRCQGNLLCIYLLLLSKSSPSRANKKNTCLRAFHSFGPRLLLCNSQHHRRVVEQFSVRLMPIHDEKRGLHIRALGPDTPSHNVLTPMSLYTHRVQKKLSKAVLTADKICPKTSPRTYRRNLCCLSHKPRGVCVGENVHVRARARVCVCVRARACEGENM